MARGGYVDTQLFLAMTRQRLGNHVEARRLFDSFATWLKAQDFQTWQVELRWHFVHEEARKLILTMPRAEN